MRVEGITENIPSVTKGSKAMEKGGGN